MNHQTLMYAAAASVAGAAFLYIFCDPTEPRRRCGVGRRRGRTVHVHGLVNRGNQCFVNSVVQAFASCPALMHRLAECIQQRRVLFDLCARTRAWLLEGVSSDHESLPITSSRSIWSFLLFGRKRIQRPLKLDFSGLNQCNLSLSAIAADQARLTKAMHHILTALNGQDNGGRLILSAALIIDALKTPTFCCNNEEQDAHELFNLIISSLEEENKNLTAFLPFDEYKNLSIDQVQDPIEEKIENNKLKFELPTKGLLANVLGCANCGHKYTIGLEQFHSITLFIPEKKGSMVTLENCLSQFVRPEMISNVTCQKCTDIAVNDTTTNMSNFVKRQAFARLPAVLCLHIQRLAWLSDGRLAKKAQVIHFPEKLTMDSYIFTFTKDNHKSPLDSLPLVGGNSQFNCDTTQNPNPSTFTYIHGQQYGQAGDSHANHSLADSSSPSSPAKHLYALCAVVVHLGGPFNGHYVCYRKLQIGDKIQWFYVSDETVVPCSLQKVLSVPAYMLFYEKQSNT